MASMNDNSSKLVKEICDRYGNDSSRLMDIALEVQKKLGCVAPDAIDILSAVLNVPRVSVDSLVSFYAFMSEERKGSIVIRICNDVVDMMQGTKQVAEAFSKELGIPVGGTTEDGAFTLEYTPCIGMCDQAPAALVNDVVVTRLTAEKAAAVVKELKKHKDPFRLVHEYGDSNNGHDLVRAMVTNNIRERGQVIFGDMPPGAALKNAIQMTPQEVIRAVKTARLRGRGGAGFPAGMKWEFTRAAEGSDKVLICNADEGEPGTFKDRVILTERAALLFEGMAVSGYAIGAELGILYLRGEYAYLHAYLESVLASRRSGGLLGKNICGKEGFNFDIRIQMGGGAYVCGEETALISSCEGLRGDPKNRPPFPAQKGYLGRPTSVNNVETLCCAARIIEKGAPWFTTIGNEKSTGTKLISISGDCKKPGVYEIPFGTTVKGLLAKAGAKDTVAVQVGGPSGSLIDPGQFDRVICFDDLATGGAVVVFGEGRDLLDVVEQYLEFFVDESCGYCTPCRVGNTLLLDGIKRVRRGTADKGTLDMMSSLSLTMKAASRCGLGQTSFNPVLTAMKNFPQLFAKAAVVPAGALRPGFDVAESAAAAASIAGRPSTGSGQAPSTGSGQDGLPH